MYPPVPKKRRVQRACDSCRHRRKACDGLRMSEKKCTNCVEIGLECTFSGAVAKRSYAEVLEVRLEQNEQQLYQISPPSTSTSSTPDSNHWSKDSSFLTHPSTSTSAQTIGPGVELAALTIRSMNTPAPDPHGDDLEYISLKQDMEDLSLRGHDKHFHGKSSGAMLVKSAVLLRMRYEDRDLPWKKRRMHYWTFQPAKSLPPHTGPYLFPSPTLLTSLISLYFTHSNIYYPVLHHPTFTRLVDSSVHLNDRGFAAVLLVVCAIGSRFSDDPLALGEGEGVGEGEWKAGLTCGWKWYGQVKEEVPHLFERPGLYNLQYYALAAIFTESSVPAARFTLVGLGLRLATDVGAHRLTNKENYKNENLKDKADSELWGRAFWVLVVLDRQISSGLGRACGVGWEDFDLPLPLEVDDEYWEQGFAQPAGVPSKIAYFNCFIRLNDILAVGLKGLYALNKTKKLLATRDDNWEEHIVAELDKALADWVDALPAHLRWDPNKQSDDFYNQSAYLHAVYYWMQMTLHRPLIMKQQPQNSDRALRSIAISTNAARSCAHICDISRFRKGAGPFPLHIALAFSAGLVLLLNVWSGKRTGLPPEMNTAMAEVRKCMECLRACEERWQSAGLFYDLLDEIAQLDQLPPPPKAPSASPSPASSGSTSGSQNQKRAREEDSAYSESSTIPAPPVPYPPPQPATFPSKAALPTYPADLRRLPVFNTHYPPSPSDPLSRSTWYPDQTSTAPLGCPDFTVTMPSHGQFDTAGYEDEAAMPSAFDSPGNENRTGNGNGMNSDAVAVWANAPTGFEVDAWGGYFSLISEMSRGLDPELT